MMRPKNILLALALSVSAAGTLYAQQDVIALDSLPVVHFTDGVRLMKEERFEEALAKFEKVLKSQPDHDPSMFEAANALSASGDIEKALEYSSRAAALDPDNSWYTGLQARLMASAGRYDEALALFENITGEGKEFDPDNYRMLAILYHQKGRTDDAVAALERAEVRMGATPQTIEMKRGMLVDADRIDDAIAVTERYIADNPYDESNRFVLAEMYAYRGRDSLGIAMLKEVVEINPDNAAALEKLADLYLAKNQTALYFATVKQLFLLDDVPVRSKIDRFNALAGNQTFYRRNFMEMGDLALTLAVRYSGDDEVLELYSDHAVRGGDGEGALTMLKGRLARPDPPLSTFIKTIQIEAYLMRRPDSVAVSSERALAVYPDEVQIYLLRSAALQFMGDNKGAHKTLSRALKVAATDSLRSEIYGAIGWQWNEEGNKKKTSASYRKALEYNPDNTFVLNNYAYFFVIEGRELDRALEMASRAVKLKENDPNSLDTYAWILYTMGDYAGAKKIMQQALPLDRGNNPELLIHYGDILWALGEEFMASTYWKRARDAGWKPASDIEERLSRIE